MISKNINPNDYKEEKKVLSITALAEFAERYGYYVVQSLLIFFLIEKFNISQEMSASLVGTTLAMVYISAILGGYIAERFLGYYRSGMLGAVFMVAGFFTLASTSSLNMLCLGLSLMSVSTGLIKSNMGCFIGRFYDKSTLSDSRRDLGFNIFYMGINLGGFFALFLATWLKDTYGYGAPFYSSMAVSIIMLCLLFVGFKIVNKHVIDFKLSLSMVLRVSALLVIYMVLLFYIFKHSAVADLSVFIAFLGSIVILIISIRKSNLKKVIVAGIFFLLSIAYWAVYFQMFISLLLFTQYSVDHSILNASQFLSVTNMSVLIFAVIMGNIWIFLENKGLSISDIGKFNIGFMIMIVALVIILIFILISPGSEAVSSYGFIIGYFIIGISELSLSAIGLSMITKIAPKGFVALYMGIWLVTLGIGGKVGGVLASFFYIPKDDIILAKANMCDALDTFIVISVIASISILLIRKFVNRHYG